MTVKLLSSFAAAAALAATTALAPAAFAQSQPSDTTAPAAQTAPAVSPDAANPAAAPDTSAQAPVAAGTATAQAGTYLTRQSPDQISANTYIGQSVYNAGNQSVGKITDLIMQKDGGIVAAVVGVGGFLGIGSKDVAVPIGNIDVAQNSQDGTVKLTTSETTESLKAAPEFKTLEMQASERAPANSTTGSVPTDNTATGSTNQ